MRKLFVVLAVVFLMAVPGLVFAGDVETPAVVEEKGSFDDWYGMLEMQGGTTYSFKSQAAMPYIAGKILGYREVVGIFGTEIDVDEKTEVKGPVSVLVGATYNLGNLRGFGVDVPWMQHFGFNVGVCGTYEFEGGDFGLKATLSVVDLSFSDGNAKRQRQR